MGEHHKPFAHKKDPQTLCRGSKSLSRGRLKEQFNHF